jgi:cytochrome c oxidase cbb3-type subunit 3
LGKPFSQLIVACHRADAGGQMVLATDDHWILGRNKNIFSTINNGVVRKGMISWKGTLKPKRNAKSSCYVISLKRK